MSVVRVFFRRGLPVCDRMIPNSTTTGLIRSEAKWRYLCEGLPNQGSSWVMVATRDDKDFEHGLDARLLKEYTLVYAERWLGILTKPPPMLNLDMLWTEERKKEELSKSPYRSEAAPKH